MATADHTTLHLSTLEAYPHPSLRDAVAVSRFWRFVDRRDSTECWRWMRGYGSHGYGVFYLPGRVQVLAHRYALGLTEPAPPGAHALHSCDHKWCVNPAHLRWGTHADNMRDAAERGLAKPGRTLPDACPSGHPYTAENTLTTTRAGAHGKRYTVHNCRECNRIYHARRRAKRKEA